VLTRLAREPLVHFCALGAILFAVGRWQDQRTNPYRIELTRAHVAQIAREYALQYGAPPDGPTLESLIRDDLHDEMLYRLGVAQGLDRDDEIVRRRIVQKEQFLIQNLHPPAEPDDGRLQAWYDAHRAAYAAPPRATFSHIFFAVGRGGDARAQARARSALAGLSSAVTRAPERGDVFPDLYDYAAHEPEQVARLFGHTPFAGAVFAAPVGRWSGPYRSAYGWHLVFVDARAAGGQPLLAAIRDQVRTDYLQAAQDEANAAAFAGLTRRFTVIRDDGATPR
jgi:peptidyl-prolyl cis-trans isomerase C